MSLNFLLVMYVYHIEVTHLGFVTHTLAISLHYHFVELSSMKC